MRSRSPCRYTGLPVCKRTAIVLVSIQGSDLSIVLHHSHRCQNERRISTVDESTFGS
jgi:hypothetical protein